MDSYAMIMIEAAFTKSGNALIGIALMEFAFLGISFVLRTWFNK